MQKNTKLRLGVVAAAAAVALTFSAALPANADPTQPTPGGFRPLVGVGSDTTESVMNGIAAAYNGGNTIASYNATDGNVNNFRSAIQTRATGPTFLRSNGSGDGQIALSRSIVGSNGTPGGISLYPASNVVSNGVTFAPTNIIGQVDFARSSSGPSSSLPGTDLTFIPFAQENVTFAVNAASDFPRSIAWGNQAGTSNTAFTLINIYNCRVTSYRSSSFATITINPLIPQSGSGTRGFWIGPFAMNLPTNLPSCVKDAKTTGPKQGTVQEHDGRYITQAGDIAPFSVAQFLAQSDWQSQNTPVTERRGNIALGSIDTIKPMTLPAAGGVTANPSFPINRPLYNVVATSRLDPLTTVPEDIALQAAFVGPTSGVCSQVAQIQAYGAATITTCGDISQTQAFKLS